MIAREKCEPCSTEQESDELARPKYLFASVAIFLPFVVVGGWLFAEHSSVGNAANGYLGLFLGAFLYIATVIGLGAGSLCATIALIRSDQNKLLAIVGLLLNLLSGLWIAKGMKF
jgi:hypothetical protein